MTPTRLRECLNLLHWSQRGLAEVLSYDEGTVRGWARGVRPVPPQAAAWLEALAAAHAAHPAPRPQSLRDSARVRARAEA